MTGPEAIALAGIVLSALLGYLSYRTAKDAREDAHALARENREVASADARAGRLHERRKDVYEEVLEYTYRLEDLVHRTEPIISFGGDPPPPEWPSDDELRAQSARTAAWCSPELLAKLLEMKGAAAKFQSEVWVLRAERQRIDKGKEIEQWKKVEDQRQVVKALVKDVVALANEDLRR